MSLREGERQPIIEIIESEHTLPQRIREIALHQGTASFDKRREIAAVIENALRERGSFLRTTDSRVFFFSRDERKVFDVEQTDFRRTLTKISGLSATEEFFSFSLDVLQANTLKTSPLTELRTFSFFNSRENFLAVSDGAGGVWTRGHGEGWREGNNGDDGLFFLTEPSAVPFVPEFRTDDAPFRWYLDRFLFGRNTLSPDDARVLLSVFLFHQFFPCLRQTRVIPAFLGPQGSGKSTAERLIGRLLQGPHFEVSGLRRNKEDAFVAALSNRVILGIDNADSRIVWLPDALALYATGQQFLLRKLYTTNEEASYPSRAILMLSSRDAYFNRPDVSERLLPFHFARPENYQAEHILYQELDARRPEIIGAMLQRAAEIADILWRTESPPLPFRMADFATFGFRVLKPSGKSNEWLALLKKVESAQSAFAAEDDGVLAALRLLLGREGEIEDTPVGDLYKRVKRIGDAESVPLPKNAQGFGRYLNTHKRVIELELGVQINEIQHGGGIRAVTIKRR